MFGKKEILKTIKDLQDNGTDSRSEQKEMKQRILLLESEVKRLAAILDFLSYRKKMEDRPLSADFPLRDVDTDVLIPDIYVQKIDELSKIEFATKEDINRIDNKFMEIFNTISGLFKAIPTFDNKTDEVKIL